MVAWGIEEPYGSGKGRHIMAGQLKRMWPTATHMTFDVRGFIENDPSKRALSTSSAVR